LVVTSTELCQALHFSSPFDLQIASELVRKLDSQILPTTKTPTEGDQTDANAFEVDRTIEVEPSASETNFSTPH